MWFCRWIRSTNKQLVTHGVKTPSASLSYCVCASDGGRRKIISVSSGWSAWNKGQIKLMWVFFFCLCSYWKEKGAADTKLFLIFTWMLTSGQYAQDWLFTGSVQPVSRLESHRHILQFLYWFQIGLVLCSSTTVSPVGKTNEPNVGTINGGTSSLFLLPEPHIWPRVWMTSAQLFALLRSTYWNSCWNAKCLVVQGEDKAWCQTEKWKLSHFSLIIKV